MTTMLNLGSKLQGTFEAARARAYALYQQGREGVNQAYTSAVNAPVAIKLQSVARDHLTREKLAEKTHAFIYAKIFPWSTPAWLAKDMDKAAGRVNRISRMILNRQTELDQLNAQIKDLESRQEKRQDAEGKPIEVSYKKLVLELDALNQEFKKQRKAFSKDKKQNVDPQLKTKILAIKKELPSEILKHADLYRRQALLESLLKKLPESLSKAKLLVQHHTNVYRSIVVSRIFTPVTAATKLLMPGGDAVANVILSTATSLVQIKSASDLPNTAIASTVRGGVQLRVVCGLTCTLVSIACLPTVRSLASTAFENAHGTNSTL